MRIPVSPKQAHQMITGGVKLYPVCQYLMSEVNDLQGASTCPEWHFFVSDGVLFFELLLPIHSQDIDTVIRERIRSAIKEIGTRSAVVSIHNTEILRVLLS